MEDFIKQSPECQKSTTPPVEPMLEIPLQLKGTNYILVVDYFSRYVEVKSLTSTTAANVVTALKSIFSRHGVPVILMTDNGPQFSCNEMAEFAELYGFHHQTSSPHYPVKWPVGKGSEDSQRPFETLCRSVHGTPELSSNSAPILWTQPSQAIDGATYVFILTSPKQPNCLFLNGPTLISLVNNTRSTRLDRKETTIDVTE